MQYYIRPQIFFKLIDEAISEIEVGQKPSEITFLTELLKQHDLKRDEVIILTSSLFIDSLSTTIPILMNNLYALATNEDVQNKAYEEICEVTKQKDEISGDTLNKLTYLRAVTKETFRMYPNGAEVARINKTPLILSNYKIPAGSHLSLNLLVHYRSKEYFSEPNTFKPERWLRGSSEVTNVNPYLLTPFGIGARTCAGRRFADQYLHMSLYKILKAFRLSYPVDGPSIDFIFSNLIFPDKCLPIQFTPRQ